MTTYIGSATCFPRHVAPSTKDGGSAAFTFAHAGSPLNAASWSAPIPASNSIAVLFGRSTRRLGGVPADAAAITFSMLEPAACL